MNRTLHTTILLLVLLSWPSVTSAQESRTYVGGAFAISSWGSDYVSWGTPSTTYTNASTETMSIGVVGEAGWFFNRSAAVGVEVALPFQRNNLTQRFSYFTPYLRESRYREQTIFLVLRGQLHATGRIRVALVGGGGVVHGSSLDRYARGTFGSTVFGPFGEQTELTHTALAVTAGTDLAIEATPTLTVVPQFRLLMVRRGDAFDLGSSFADLGLRKVVYRLGIGLRAAF